MKTFKRYTTMTEAFIDAMIKNRFKNDKGFLSEFVEKVYKGIGTVKEREFNYNVSAKTVKLLRNMGAI